MKLLKLLLILIIFTTCKSTDPSQLVNTTFKSKYRFECVTDIHNCLSDLRERKEYLYFLSEFPDSIIIQEVSSSCHEVVIFRSWLGQEGSVNECAFPVSGAGLYAENNIGKNELLILSSIRPSMKMSIFGEFYNNAIVGLFSLFIPIPHYNYRPYSYKVSKIDINRLGAYLDGK